MPDDDPQLGPEELSVPVLGGSDELAEVRVTSLVRNVRRCRSERSAAPASRCTTRPSGPGHDAAVTAELIAVLVRRLSDPSLLRDQGRATRALAERELDVRQTWQGLAAVYARALGQAPQG